MKEAEIKVGRYQHPKSGKQYRVICIAKHSESLEEMVVYEALYKNSDSKYWVRLASMFSELVEIAGKKVPRFVYIGEK